ncbi:MAG: TonB-dependent receptor plug domain-containing protein, partial [Lacunisphaera sp.]
MKANLSASLGRVLILAGVLPVISAFAQTSSTENLPDYVFSATRTPAALTTTGSYVETISAAELARMQLTSLQSALGGIPGAPAFSSGARGAITSLFMRGSNSNQTLFLVDGIRLNDPNTDYQVYLGGACVGACDSLEISHGPQSTLYGGEAMGGVISLTTQKGSGPEKNTVSVEAGSFGTVQGTLSSQGGDAQSSYNFSAAGGSTQNDRPNNDFTSTTYALRLDHKLNDKVAIGGTYRGFIGAYGSPGDRFTNDPDNHEKESNQLATVFATFTPTSTFNSKVILGGQDRRYEAISPSSFGTSDTLVKNSR